MKPINTLEVNKLMEWHNRKVVRIMNVISLCSRSQVSEEPSELVRNQDHVAHLLEDWALKDQEADR